MVVLVQVCTSCMAISEAGISSAVPYDKAPLILVFAITHTIALISLTWKTTILSTSE